MRDPRSSWNEDLWVELFSKIAEEIKKDIMKEITDGHSINVAK